MMAIMTQESHNRECARLSDEIIARKEKISGLRGEVSHLKTRIAEISREIRALKDQIRNAADKILAKVILTHQIENLELEQNLSQTRLGEIESDLGTEEFNLSFAEIRYAQLNC